MSCGFPAGSGGFPWAKGLVHDSSFLDSWWTPRSFVRTEVLSLGPQGQRQPRAGIARGRFDQKGLVHPTEVVEYEIP